MYLFSDRSHVLQGLIADFYGKPWIDFKLVFVFKDQ